MCDFVTFFTSFLPVVLCQAVLALNYKDYVSQAVGNKCAFRGPNRELEITSLR